MVTSSSPSTSAPVATAPASLYEAIGGQAAITAAVDVFYTKMLADPVLSPYFPNGVGSVHRAHIATFLGEALGGPRHYRGRDLAQAHQKLAITDAHFNQTAGHLAATLAELGVPDDLVGRVIEVVAGVRPAIVAG
jgi:hemoglobin